jgi:uncharacterized membrane protein
MAGQEGDTLYVVAATYPQVEAASAEYDAVKALYRDTRTSHSFDASVVAKDEDGTVRILRMHEEPAHHGAVAGLGWGLAVGVVAVLFPPVGIGLVAAGVDGPAIGGVAGHVLGGMSRNDLKDLGEAVDAGRAGLVVVCEEDLVERVTAAVTSADRVLSRPTEMADGRLEEDMRRAEHVSHFPQQFSHPTTPSRPIRSARMSRRGT